MHRLARRFAAFGQRNQLRQRVSAGGQVEVVELVFEGGDDGIDGKPLN
jgi:hypothetical protein